MASRLEEDLTCPICHELFRDPVFLSCSHNFCKVCMENWWKDKPKKTCPVCKRRSSKDFPPLNLTVKNLLQTYVEQRDQAAAEPLCSLHSEKLRLFCLDHQQLVCLVCGDSRTHKDHRFSPIEEAASDLREQLQTSIKPLQDKLQVLTERKEQFEEAVDHITAQAKHTEKEIQQQFEKLHQFLLEEEKSRMKDLRKEEEQKTQNMKDKIVAVSRELETVSKTITETEEQLRATDTSFLLHHKSIVERVQRCPLVEELKIKDDSLINQAKHLGNLSFNIWTNMKRLVQFYPVILDPNTTAPKLILSEDLSSVKCGETQKLPQNRGRFPTNGVFGSELFTSGTHSWDVEVGENKDWNVGVMGHVQRGEGTKVGVWWIHFSKDKYSALSLLDTDVPLSVKSLQRVRVKLDFDRGTVTFSDADTDTDTDLHTFTDTSTKGLVPYLATKNNIPLKILPSSVVLSVKV
ncbi:zinc-binding protein A33-like [Eucyclogobius newberryi]|uniref:zinc-binding protein A33-like n=1 Tax=Eucyclogobius newberryi TaxID=166745 RepID=UPI003B591070